MMPLSKSLSFGMTEWFLSADDELLASESTIEFRYTICLLSFGYVKTIVYEGQK